MEAIKIILSLILLLILCGCQYVPFIRLEASIGVREQKAEQIEELKEEK